MSFYSTHCYRLQTRVTEIIFVDVANAIWVVAPAPYTYRFEQLVSIEITEGEGFEYKVVSNFRRGLNNVDVRCILSSEVHDH